MHGEDGAGPEQLKPTAAEGQNEQSARVTRVKEVKSRYLSAGTSSKPRPPSAPRRSASPADDKQSVRRAASAERPRPSRPTVTRPAQEDKPTASSTSFLHQNTTRLFSKRKSTGDALPTTSNSSSSQAKQGPETGPTLRKTGKQVPSKFLEDLSKRLAADAADRDLRQAKGSTKGGRRSVPGFLEGLSARKAEPTSRTSSNGLPKSQPASAGSQSVGGSSLEEVQTGAEQNEDSSQRNEAPSASAEQTLASGEDPLENVTLRSKARKKATTSKTLSVAVPQREHRLSELLQPGSPIITQSLSSTITQPPIRTRSTTSSPARSPRPSLCSLSAPSSPSKPAGRPVKGGHPARGNPSGVGTSADRAKSADSAAQTRHVRVLHNRWLQWRFVNAKAEETREAHTKAAEASLWAAHKATEELRASVTANRIELHRMQQEDRLDSLLSAQAPLLEEWASKAEAHRAALEGTSMALEAALLRVPLTSRAKADVTELQAALAAASEAVRTDYPEVQEALPRAQATASVLTRLADTVVRERNLIRECQELMKQAAQYEVEERSLRAHLMQVEREKRLGRLASSSI